MKAQVGPRPSMQLAESDPEVLAVLSFGPTEIRDYRATLPGFWRSILLTLCFRACQAVTLPAQPIPEAFFFFFESQHCDYKLSSYTRGSYTLGSAGIQVRGTSQLCVGEGGGGGLCCGPWSSKE